MKNFLILHGPTGVGKSTVSRHVCHLLQPSALLEGDWCWQIFPFCPHEENKEMALKHMIYLLNSYLHNKNISYLVFNWVLQDDKIFKKFSLFWIFPMLRCIVLPFFVRKRLWKKGCKKIFQLGFGRQTALPEVFPIYRYMHRQKVRSWIPQTFLPSRLQSASLIWYL